LILWQIRVAKQIAENMCDILDGGEYRGVVNAPDLSAINKVAGLKPFVLLAEKIGSVHAQLLGSSKVNAVSITLRGKLVADSRVTDILKSALLKGMLGSLSDSTSVSYVNAISTAQEMGLEVNINMSETTMAQSGYTDTITVDVELEGLLNMTRTIEGTIFGENDVRITEIDGFPISFPEGESVLLFNNVDEPGVLYKVSKKLADIGINVLQLSVGRKSNAKKALCVLILDSTMPKEVVSTFGKDLGLSNVMQLEFDKNEDPIFRVRDSGVKDKDVGMAKPAVRPRHPEFSSGPCKKRPGYSLNTLRTDVLGRSHRSKLGKGRIMKAMEDTKRILGVPQEYVCGIVPASDTGAMEMAMVCMCLCVMYVTSMLHLSYCISSKYLQWSMLGPKPVDVCYWEAFGKGWKEDIVSHLKIPSVREFSAPYGSISDLSATNSDHDIIFTYNGTTSGVRVPNLDWISSSRTGLTFNDATSAAFAMDIDWSKVDVTTFSWQKVLGGEGAHGVLILSPRAVERLETYKCPRALPKIFRMTKTDKAGKITFEKSIFSGDTINTPSMLCVEDYLDALEWAESVGGLAGLQKRSLNNLSIMEKFVGENPWISFLAEDPAIRSSTSVCFKMQLTQPQTKKFVSLLEAEGVAFDIGSYRDAPDGLRIWCGATVSPEDLEALLPWLKVRAYYNI
jgi:phosphoserine aminotransferase